VPTHRSCGIQRGQRCPELGQALTATEDGQAAGGTTRAPDVHTSEMDLADYDAPPRGADAAAPAGRRPYRPRRSTATPPPRPPPAATGVRHGDPTTAPTRSRVTRRVAATLHPARADPSRIRLVRGSFAQPCTLLGGQIHPWRSVVIRWVFGSARRGCHPRVPAAVASPVRRVTHRSPSGPRTRIGRHCTGLTRIRV